MNKVLILIKRKDRVSYKQTFSYSLSQYLASSGGHSVTRAFIGDVSHIFDANRGSWRALINGKKIEDYDLVYLRTVGLYRDQATAIVRYCERNNIKVIQDNYGSTVSNSKLIQSVKLLEAGLPIPKTYYLGSSNSSNIALKYPLVAKNILGKGGAGVSLLKNEREAIKFYKNENMNDYLLQEYIENEFDWRILVVDGKMVYGCKRIRVNDDFRNNVKLGAREELSEPDAKVSSLSVKAAKALGINVAGVDVIESAKGCFVIEINKSPSIPVSNKIFKGVDAVGEYIKKCLR